MLYYKGGISSWGGGGGGGGLCPSCKIQWGRGDYVHVVKYSGGDYVLVVKFSRGNYVLVVKFIGGLCPHIQKQAGGFLSGRILSYTLSMHFYHDSRVLLLTRILKTGVIESIPGKSRSQN